MHTAGWQVWGVQLPGPQAQANRGSALITTLRSPWPPWSWHKMQGDRPTLAHLCLSPGVTMSFLPSAHWPGLVHNHTHRQRGGTYGDRRSARCAPGPLPRPAQMRREGLGYSHYTLVSLSSPVIEQFPPQLWFNLQSTHAEDLESWQMPTGNGAAQPCREASR